MYSHCTRSGVQWIRRSNAAPRARSTSTEPSNSALQRADRHAPEEHSRDVQGLPEWKPLHSRLIEVNSQMTEKVRDLEQTVSGYKDNQWNPHAGIDFSKIEADLTELKTFLYKQQRLARETRSQEAKD